MEEKFTMNYYQNTSWNTSQNRTAQPAVYGWPGFNIYEKEKGGGGL